MLFVSPSPARDDLKLRPAVPRVLGLYCMLKPTPNVAWTKSLLWVESAFFGLGFDHLSQLPGRRVQQNSQLLSRRLEHSKDFASEHFERR